MRDAVLGLLLLTCPVLLTCPAAVAVVEPPAALVGPTITLAEAVGITLRNDPGIRQAVQAVEAQRAALMEASGAFDGTLVVDTLFAFASDELFGPRLQFERDRRLRFELAYKALDLAADSIIARLPTAGSLLFDRCTANQRQVVITTPDGTRVILCLNSSGELRGIVTPGSGTDFSEIFRLILLLEPEIVAGTEDTIEFFTDLMRILARQLRLASRALKIGHERLGSLPDEEQFLQLDFLLARQFRFRNGVAFTTSLSLNGSEDNFADKPLNPLFGDTVFPNVFTTSLAMTLDVPLGKGRGRVAVAAPERAAAASLAAARELLAHTASERALAAVNAYWRLAAAQARLKLLAEAAATQRRIVDNTRQLVEADQVVKAELERNAARYAEVLGDVARGRQEVVEARLDLVAAMGLTAAGLEHAPLAAETLSESFPAPVASEVWVREAHARRHDLAAAAETSRASAILARAARANRRHQVDLSLNAGFSGLYESFVDRVYDPEGYWRAADGQIAGPSYGIKLRWRLPVGNNQARGRLLQAEAALAQSQITEADLKRLIRLRIEEISASLEHLRSELRELRESLAGLAETLDSSLELYPAGELTLIDTLLTEEQLTDARLAEIDTVRRIAELESELRFQAGQLLEEEEETGDFDPARLRLALFRPPQITP